MFATFTYYRWALQKAVPYPDLDSYGQSLARLMAKRGQIASTTSKGL